MEIIRNRMTDVKFSLHDAHVKKIAFSNNIIIFEFDYIFEYINGKELIHKVEVLFTEADIDYARVYVFDGVANAGQFTGRVSLLSDFINEHPKVDFEIISETYHGYDTVWEGWLWLEDGPVTCILTIWNQGEMIYRLKEKSATKVNFLVSDFPNGFSDVFIQELKKYQEDFKQMAFVASDFDGYERTEHFMKNIIHRFEEKGVSFSHSMVIDNRIKAEKAREVLRRSDMVWLAGGPTLRQIASIKEMGLIETLQQREGITIGMSAGAINMAKRVVLAKDLRDDIPETVTYDGIGLVEINIEPHLDLAETEHIHEVKEAARIHPIIGLPDESFIVEVNGEIQFFGPYEIFEKNNRI